MAWEILVTKNQDLKKKLGCKQLRKNRQNNNEWRSGEWDKQSWMK